MKKQITYVLLLLLAVLSVKKSYSQATPANGDIVFTAADADGDVVEFLTLARLNLNDFRLTNNGICSNGLFRLNETIAIFPSTGLADIPVGTIVRVDFSTGTNDLDVSDGKITVFINGLNISDAGDQIIGYTGTANGSANCSGGSGTNTYVSGINWGNSGWNGSGATSDNNSKAPNSSTDFDPNTTNDDIHYNGTVEGTIADLISTSGNGIRNFTNWSTTNSGAGDFDLKNILLQESDLSSGSVVFTSISTSQMELDLDGLSFDNNANANTRYIVLVRAGSAPDAPVDRYSCYTGVTTNIGTTTNVVTSVTGQTATNFCGTPTSGNGKVVYYDYILPSSLTVTGLSSSTTYHIAVYAINGNGYTTNYSSSPALGNTPTPSLYTWNVASGNWNTAASWTPARTTPVTSDVLVFDGNTQATPSVTVDISETIREIQLINSAEVTFTGSSTGSPTMDNINLASGTVLSLLGNNISVRGTITGPGSISATTGTVTMNGASAQTITGSPSITNLTLNNSSGATISSGTLSISRSFSHTDGTLTTNGNLILVATAADSYGQIDVTGTGDVSGSVTMQYFIPSSATNGFRNICSPFTGNTINDLTDDITLNFGSPSFKFGNVFSFNEEDAGSSNQGGWQLASSTSSLDNEGYSIFIFDVDLSSDLTIDVTGTYTKGDYTTPALSRTGSLADSSGWHIIRNPWPSNYDHSTTITNLESNTMYVYEGNTVRDWNGSTGTLTNGVVPPFHAIYVRINSNNNTLTLPASNRTITNSANLLDKTSLTNYVAMKVTNKNNIWDETRVYTNAEAKNNKDYWDAAKVVNGFSAPTIYTIVDDFKASINNLNNIPEEGITIPVEFRTKVGGEHTMSFTLDNVDPRFNVVLEDIFKNETHLVSNGDYTFNHNPDFDATYHRFNLRFVRKSATAVEEISDNDIYIGSNDKNVTVSFVQEGNYSIEVYDLMGRTVAKTNRFNTARTSTKTVAVNNTATGYYIVKVKGNNSYKTAKVFLK